MKRLDPETIDYYNSEIVPMIAEKYGYSQMDALRVFVASKTHEMLENEDCGLTAFGAGAVFEIWETAEWRRCAYGIRKSKKEIKQA